MSLPTQNLNWGQVVSAPPCGLLNPFLVRFPFIDFPDVEAHAKCLAQRLAWKGVMEWAQLGSRQSQTPCRGGEKGRKEKEEDHSSFRSSGWLSKGRAPHPDCWSVEQAKTGAKTCL